jgi:hypothetical protein
MIGTLVYKAEKGVSGFYVEATKMQSPLVQYNLLQEDVEKLLDESDWSLNQYREVNYSLFRVGESVFAKLEPESNKEEVTKGEWQSMAEMLYLRLRETYGRSFEEWPEAIEYKKLKTK